MAEHRFCRASVDVFRALDDLDDTFRQQIVNMRTFGDPEQIAQTRERAFQDIRAIISKEREKYEGIPKTGVHVEDGFIPRTLELRIVISEQEIAQTNSPQFLVDRYVRKAQWDLLETIRRDKLKKEANVSAESQGIHAY